MKKIPCPQCQKPVDLSKKTEFRPFCSERCRLIDLGAWASEDYQIDGQPMTGEESELENLSEEEWSSSQLH
ncbi:MAG: DNA gyrase inhibitor YacG [Motiliproteus sp.]|nr:DNA gyrase inhibitor YacG [Motiliproteus sp.]MCW9052244.1 DNA gyrase inhibitor YacG [Motiliproteus sp.]